MESTKSKIVGGIALVVLFGLSLFYLLKPSSYLGMELNPAAAAAPISLTDSNGNLFQLANQRGKIVLVFFGYTNCPDECPITMAKLKQALQELGDSQAENIEVVLVTTDPVRDSVERLHEYVTKFNPAFLGVTGTVDELQPVWDSYGVVVEDGGETHSELVYVIDATGKLRLTFSSDLQSQDIAHDLQALLSE